MPMTDWGGGIDYSGLFAGLARQAEAAAVAATNRNLQRSQEEKAADDAEKYDQWKNGIISDDEWLAYLRQRVAETTDPQEHQHWVETLRQHESAIADDQMETNFATGAVSIHKLIAYYKGRMAGVEKRSPAYRQWAARYAQLIESRDAGSYTGGSGGSSGGSRGSYWPRGLAPSSGTGGPGEGAGGADDQGPVDPTNTLRAPAGFDDYMDGLFGDLDRIDTLMKQLDSNPGAKTLTDPLTGEVFQVTPEVIQAIDAQYLRTEDLVAAAKWADGDVDGATQALKNRGTYIANTMQKHNSTAVRPAWDEASNTFFSGLVAASQIADPEARARFYQNLYANVQSSADRILYAATGNARTPLNEGVDDTSRGMSSVRVTADLPEELRVDDTMANDIMTTLKMAQAFGDPDLTLEGRAALISDVQDNRPENYRLSTDQIQEYADGNADIGLIGGMETHVARQALAEGTANFFYDGQTMRVMTPEEIQDPAVSGEGGVVSTLQNVNGRSERVFVATRPVESDFFAYQYTSDADAGGKTDLAGTYVPSSEINAMSKGQLNQLLASGKIQAVAVQPGWRSVVTPGGSVWYEDPETGLWYKNRLPVNLAFDVTGGLAVSDEGEPQFSFKGFASTGGVLMPFDGISPKQAQSLIEAAVANGEINLADYGSRDASGDAQYAPPDVADMYWSRADPQTAFAQKDMRELLAMKKDAFSRRQEDRIRTQAKTWVRENLDSYQQRDWRNLGVDPVDYASQQLRRMSDQMGIKLLDEAADNTPSAPRPQGGPAAMPAVRANQNIPQTPSAPANGNRAANRVMPPPPVRLAPLRNPPESADSTRTTAPTPAPRPTPSAPVPAASPRRNNFRETL